MSTAAPRIESELQRRYLITVEPSGVVHLRDTNDRNARDEGWPVFSAHTDDVALWLVASFAVRSRDGDGWVTRAPWSGSLRDVGDLQHKLGLTYDAILGERGETW